MSNNNLSNPNGSMRRTVHRPPPPPPPPPLPPPDYQQPPQPYNCRNTFAPAQVHRTGTHVRMPQVDHHNSVIVQQHIHHQISALFSRGSHEIRFPVPTQSISASQPSPQQTPLPQVLSLQPVPHPPTPAENLAVVVSTSLQSEQGETKETLEKSDEISVEELEATAAQHYEALGQAIGIMTKSFKSNEVKLGGYYEENNELRAQKEVQSERIRELEKKVAFLNNNVEEIRANSAKEVEHARSEHVVWKNNYLQLSLSITAVENESAVKDETIESLKETISGNSTRITQLELEVLNVKLSEKKLKQQLEERENQIEALEKKVSEREKKIKEMKTSENKFTERLQNKEKNIQLLKEDFNKKCKELSKLQGSFDNMKCTIDDFVKKEKANNATAKKLETERNHLKSVNEQLEAKNSKSVDEIARISSELEKEKKENQSKKQALEKKIKKIDKLKRAVELLDKQNDQLLKKLYDNVHQIFENYSQSRFKREKSPSSEEDPDEPLSMAVSGNKDNENGISGTSNEGEQPRYHEDVPQVTASGEKRKCSAEKCSPNKKTCGDDDANSSIDTEQAMPKLIISLPRIYQGASNGGNAKKPERSGSSKATLSGDRHQRSKSDSKQHRK